MTNQGFRKAVKYEKPLKLALAGAAGSGKTFTALLLGERIAQLRGGRMAVIDTERGSASLYADQFDFDVLEMDPPFTSEKFIQAVTLAVGGGYAVLVADSLTHYWAGSGGILELVDKASAKYGGNKYGGWAEGTPKHNAIIDAILGTRMDVIATMRTKSAYVEVEKAGGKKGYAKVGTAPVQREGIDFEFDLVIGLDADHAGTVEKGRFPELDGQTWEPMNADLAEVLISLLKGEEKPTMKLADVKTQADMARFLAQDEVASAWILPGKELAFVNKLTGNNWNPAQRELVWELARRYGSMLADGATKPAAFDSILNAYTVGIQPAPDHDEPVDEVEPPF